MIRHGNKSDVKSIVTMARKFWGQTIYSDEAFCKETVSLMAESCIDNKLMSVLDVDGHVVGFACGVKGGLLGNSSVSCGSEVAWWVDVDHRGANNGISLLRHIENLAKSSGVKYWNMTYMESSMPTIIEEIYESMGYNRSEVTYTKVL